LDGVSKPVRKRRVLTPPVLGRTGQPSTGRGTDDTPRGVSCQTGPGGRPPLAIAPRDSVLFVNSP